MVRYTNINAAGTGRNRIHTISSLGVSRRKHEGLPQASTISQGEGSKYPEAVPHMAPNHMTGGRSCSRAASRGEAASLGALRECPARLTGALMPSWP